MFDVFTNLKELFKHKEIVTDGRIFHLHYRVTAFSLFACCILVTSQQYFGEPIACMISAKDMIPEKVINSYCWVQATYNSPSQFNRVVGIEVAHPGVGLARDDHDIKYYKYYQWVGFVLFLQSMLFYAPRYLWKGFERRTVCNILFGLHLPIVDEEACNEKRQLLVDFLKNNARKHNMYALKYYFCELLAFANVVGQIYLVDRFLDGEFTTYGPEVVEFMKTDPEDRLDPMVRIFPRVTKCLFRKFGPTGEIESHAALCVLPLNIVNEKVFVLMWFWFVFLAALTGALLIMRLLTFNSRFRHYLLFANNLYINKEHAWNVIEKTDIGDWLLLYILGKNMDSRNFKIVISQLATRVNSISMLKHAESNA